MESERESEHEDLELGEPSGSADADDDEFDYLDDDGFPEEEESHGSDV